MYSRKIYAIGLVVAIALIGVIYMATSSTKQPELQPTAQPQLNALSYQCEQGKTVMEILESKAHVEFEESSFGKFVTAIDGVTQGDGKYWLYSIDGTEATVSASSFSCTGNEEVRWELK